LSSSGEDGIPGDDIELQSNVMKYFCEVTAKKAISWLLDWVFAVFWY